MFTEHYLSGPEDADEVLIGHWSYLWASLGGPIYVLAMGFPGAAAVMFAGSCVIALLAVAGLGIAATYLGPLPGVLVDFLVIPVAALTAQGHLAVELVVRGYLRRGWRAGY
ncbi:MAG: hypothetical protein PSV46_26440 [Reyranella sp.]|nr:hypothetical protein [Reyranella sp.]